MALVPAAAGAETAVRWRKSVALAVTIENLENHSGYYSS